MKLTHNTSAKKITHLSKQQGASLLEGIAYLGIAAIVILGAVSLLTGAFSSAQGNRATEEVISIRTAAKKLYMSQSSGYPVAMLSEMIDARALPSTLQVDTTAKTAQNSWGGTVTIAGAPGATFTLTYTLVPRDVCISLISNATGWESIYGVATNLAPMSVATASTTCVDGPNTIAWVGR